MDMNEEMKTEVPAQHETGKETDKKTKPNVIATLLKVTVYISSYYLMELLWETVLVVVTLFQYRADFGNEWGAFLHDTNVRTKFINAILNRTELLKWYELAAAVSWILLLFIFFRIRKQHVLGRCGLKKCSPVFFLVGALIGIGSKLLLDGICCLLPQLTGGETAGVIAVASFKDLYLSDPNSGLNAVMRVLGVGIMVPIAEEIVFRGICLDHLRKIWPVPAAVAVICVIFGLIHYPAPPVIMLFMALWSILLCLMVYRSGSVIPSVLCHMILNMISVFRSIDNIQFQAAAGGWLVGLGILFLIGGGLLLLRLRSSGLNQS